MPGNRRLRILVAGTTCVAFLFFGTQSGLAHESALPLCAWLHEARTLPWDVILFENSTEFPIHLITDKFVGSDTKIISVKVGPEVMGWPVTRARLFVAILNARTLEWCGPLGGPVDVLEDFCRFFRCKAMVDGGVWADLDDEESREQFLRHRMSKRASWPREGEGVPTRQLLPPGHHSFYDDYLAMCRDNPEYSGLRDGSFLCDLSQNPRKRRRCGPWLPTLARSSMMCCLTASSDRSQLLTPTEVDIAHGWPCLSRLCPDAFAALAAYKSNLSDSARRTLAGNGMHLAAFSAFVLYIASHSERLPAASAMDRQCAACA